MIKKQVFMFLKNSFKVICLCFILASCSNSEYDKLIRTEMSKDIVKDTLLFGMRLGQTRQTFYDQCWQLNKDGLIRQGPRNNFVQYKLPVKKGDSTVQPITMLFYGIFNEDKIMTGMDMRFYYDGWSLWNESLHAKELVPVIKDSLKSWFPGNEFIVVPAKKSNGEIQVKVDGNRRIAIEPLKDNKEVDVRIDDLNYLMRKH